MISLFFVVFLAMPIVRLLLRSFMDTNGVYTLSVYQSVFTGHKFGQALRNSFEIAALSAAVATLIAFVLAYTCYYTNLPAERKKYYSHCSDVSHVYANDHVWIRHYLFLW